VTWHVQQQLPDDWTVIHTQTGFVVGYHGTEQEANSHLAALYARADLDDDLDPLDDDDLDDDAYEDDDGYDGPYGDGDDDGYDAGLDDDS
jgi:hypothetical protein